MNYLEGWIKIHRKLLEWEWANDPNMVALWIHLLLNANVTDKKYRGTSIPRGSLMTSLTELAVETGLSVRMVRTCINRLKSTHEVTIEPTHQFSIITICKFDNYQLVNNTNDTPNDTPNDIQATHERHTSDTPLIEENKNERNINILKEKEKEKEKDDWDVLFDEWLRYKKKRRQTYKDQVSIGKMKAKLFKLSGGDIAVAREIIDEAMANNWSGFFALKKGIQQQNERYKGDDTIGTAFERRGFND